MDLTHLTLQYYYKGQGYTTYMYIYKFKYNCEANMIFKKNDHTHYGSRSYRISDSV